MSKRRKGKKQYLSTLVTNKIDMNNITSITFVDGSTVAFTNTTTITTTTAAGVVTVFSVSPVVAPTDTEVDLVLSDGSRKKFVPAV